MKYIKTIFIFAIFVLIFLISQREVNAMDRGFSTKEISKEEKDTIIKNTRISLLKNEPEKKTIQCFDVNENGLIAIGCDGLEKKTVSIYTIDGTFQYGFDFETAGSFDVEFKDDLLQIHFVRGSITIAVNPNGEIVSIREIENTFENNSYQNQYVDSPVREIDNIKYTVKNDLGFLNFFASSYTQLVITDANGEESIIYDVNSMQLVKASVMFVGCVVFIGLVLFILFKYYINFVRRN